MTNSIATNKADANAYDTWFRQQVQGALDDPRPSIPHEQVMAEIQKLIEEIRAKKK